MIDSLHPFEGKLLVVAGQCRKVGKTTLCVDLLRLLQDLPWTAVKITPYTESGCPERGASCNCSPWEHTFSIREENSRSTGKDTSRYLQGGAKNSFWVQTKAGRLADALGELRSHLPRSGFVLIESGGIAELWRPELFLMIVDPRKAVFKASASASLTCADYVLLRAPLSMGALSPAILGRVTVLPQFLQPFGYPIPALMQKIVRQHFPELPHLSMRS